MTTETNSTQPFRSIWAEFRNLSFSQGWMDAGGTPTRYLHSGSTDKPALILLHGTGGHAEAYMRNLKSHGEVFSTWAIDLIGNGWSGEYDGDLEIDVYVDHLRRFMDAAGIEKAHLSGESLGGWIAARFAIMYPERVNRLVLNTTGGSQADPAVMNRIKTISMQAVEDPSWEFIQARLQWLMADKTKVFDDLVATRQAIYQKPGAVEAMRRTLCLQEMDIRQRNLISPEDFGRIKAPSFVIWTSHDPTADVSEGRRVASMIPGALFTVMQGCGHWPQFEDAATFNRMHLAFLKGEPVEGAAPVAGV